MLLSELLYWIVVKLNSSKSMHHFQTERWKRQKIIIFHISPVQKYPMHLNSRALCRINVERTWFNVQNNANKRILLTFRWLLNQIFQLKKFSTNANGTLLMHIVYLNTRRRVVPIMSAQHAQHTSTSNRSRTHCNRIRKSNEKSFYTTYQIELMCGMPYAVYAPLWAILIKFNAFTRRKCMFVINCSNSTCYSYSYSHRTLPIPSFFLKKRFLISIVTWHWLMDFIICCVFAYILIAL